VDPPWQGARDAAAKRTSFFAHILMLTAYVVFPSWTVLLEALTNFTISPELVKKPWQLMNTPQIDTFRIAGARRGRLRSR